MEQFLIHFMKPVRKPSRMNHQVSTILHSTELTRAVSELLATMIYQ